MSNFEDNNKMEDLDNEDLTPEQSEMLANAYLSFSEKFAEYIRQIDMDLFKRAVDYAKTFTEVDIPGISLTYHIHEEDEKESEENEEK